MGVMPRMSRGLQKQNKTKKPARQQKDLFKALFGARQTPRGPLPGAAVQGQRVTEGGQSSSASIPLLHQRKLCSKGKGILEQIFWKKSKSKALTMSQSTCFKCMKIAFVYLFIHPFIQYFRSVQHAVLWAERGGDGPSQFLHSGTSSLSENKHMRGSELLHTSSVLWAGNRGHPMAMQMGPNSWGHQARGAWPPPGSMGSCRASGWWNNLEWCLWMYYDHFRAGGFQASCEAPSLVLGSVTLTLKCSDHTCKWYITGRYSLRVGWKSQN